MNICQLNHWKQHRFRKIKLIYIHQFKCFLSMFTIFNLCRVTHLYIMQSTMENWPLWKIWFASVLISQLQITWLYCSNKCKAMCTLYSLFKICIWLRNDCYVFLWTKDIKNVCTLNNPCSRLFQSVHQIFYVNLNRQKKTFSYFI